MKNTALIISAVVAATIIIVLIVANPLNPEDQSTANKPIPPTENSPKEEQQTSVEMLTTNSRDIPTIKNLPEEEQQQHGIMPMEQFAERTGKTGEVLHDSRMMIAVNGYKLTNIIPITGADGSIVDTGSELGNTFFTVDLTIRSISHAIPLSPNLFKLKTSTSELLPSPYTPLVLTILKLFF